MLSVVQLNRLSSGACSRCRLLASFGRMSYQGLFLTNPSGWCKNQKLEVISLSSSLKPATWHVPKRYYSIGDYDTLWKSATSGRGTGRGRKKKRARDIEGKFLKFGKAGLTWPGLNEPIKISDEGRRDDRHFDTGVTKEKHTSRSGRLRDASQRGWSGTSWPGRHAGVPQAANGDDIEGFDSIVIEVKKVSVTKALGKKRRTSALVCVGNKKGVIGWAIGKGPNAPNAIRKARNKAANYLHYVPVCDNHTIFHDLRTKVKSTEIKFERQPPGYGLRCQRIVRAVAELAGIQDMRCKIVGRTTPLTVVRAAFQGLEIQETHQELAERTGKLVVEYRAEQGDRPIVVAQPSIAAVKRRLEEEATRTEVDVTKFFDPARGLHKAKTLDQLPTRRAEQSWS